MKKSFNFIQFCFSATFGINLELCPPGDRNVLIPRVIEYAIDVVESRGIDMVGLYRIPGNNASVATLTERLNKGEEPNPEKVKDLLHCLIKRTIPYLQLIKIILF